MKMNCLCLGALVVGTVGLAATKESLAAGAATARALKVPGDHATIQAALDAAADGDTVLVAPGTYQESLRISGKSVRLHSQFAVDGKPETIRQTILDGIVTDNDGRVRPRDQIILVEACAGPKTEIVGFTIRNGDDGISCQADIRIAHNYFTGNDDALDYEGGGGLCEYNRFEKNRDDGVDYDLDCDATVIHNEIVDNEDDGIEIRFHDYRGPTLHLTIRDNLITGNLEDGIQIIDYPGPSDRQVRIERNVIARNAMAGIGLMSDAISDEDYRAADVSEQIEVVNNTIVENEYGITGGDNLVAINNVIAANKQLGAKKIDANSLVSHNLFWKNGTDFDDASNIRDEQTLQTDPKLGSDFKPLPGSPCIDAGVAQLTTPGGDIRVTIEAAGIEAAGKTMPDLGAFERAAK